MTRLACWTSCLCALLAAGCTRLDTARLAVTTGGGAALYGQFRAYDGRTGTPLTFAHVVERCRRADVVLFGEAHQDVVCNQLEAQLLFALAIDRRPLALAMEFFEADTQADLDAYLRRRTAEEPFLSATRQGQRYAVSHRPLIELCRALHVPVIAANAPRRLVRDYRKSGLEFEDYRASQAPADQRWLPRRVPKLHGAYAARFREMMSAGHPAPPPASQPASQPATQPTTAPASQPAMPEMSADHGTGTDFVEQLFQSQLLWDAAMSEALASARERDPYRRLLLVVGGFHVERTGGTAALFRRQRAADKICTIVYRPVEMGDLRFDPEDRGAGDVLIYGIAPAEEDQAPMPPATQPANPPAAAAPA